MSEHRNGMKKQGRDQTPLHHQQKFNDDKEQQSQPDQDPGKDQKGRPLKDPANANRLSEEE